MSGVPFSEFLSRYKAFLIVPTAYLYYSLFYKPAHINHDAEIAREFCPSYVKEFMKCRNVDLRKCKKEMMQLHNCIYKLKGINQEDKDLL